MPLLVQEPHEGGLEVQAAGAYEALELARTFSTEESVKFINGMLDGVRKKIETSR